MTLRFGVLTLPQHKMGPHCREHELGMQLGNDFSPIYSATWLSCRLSRLFSSLIFGASPTGVVWLTKGVKGSVFAYCTWMEWLACRQTRHFSPSQWRHSPTCKERVSAGMLHKYPVPAAHLLGSFQIKLLPNFYREMRSCVKFQRKQKVLDFSSKWSKTS